MITIADRQKQRRGTRAALVAANEVPLTLRQLDLAQPNIQVIQGPDALDRLRIRTDQHETLRDFVPEADGVRAVGTDARRFARVRAVSVVSGDLVFDDDKCVGCGSPLTAGQHIVLRAIRREDDALGRPLTVTVPVHLKCRSRAAK